MPNISKCPKSINLATHLQFYMKCKSSYYYVYESLFLVYSLEDLKIEELELEAEFNFYNMEDTHNNFM